MNITEIAPRVNGVKSLDELSEMVERQGFYIGQEAFYKTKYSKEKVIVSGYIFGLKDCRLQLSYCVETVESIRQVLEGTSDEPDGMLVGIDELMPITHKPM